MSNKMTMILMYELIINKYLDTRMRHIWNIFHIILNNFNFFVGLRFPYSLPFNFNIEFYFYLLFIPWFVIISCLIHWIGRDLVGEFFVVLILFVYCYILLDYLRFILAQLLCLYKAVPYCFNELYLLSGIGSRGVSFYNYLNLSFYV